MDLYGSGADKQPGPDLGVGRTLDNHLQNLPLTARKRV
jgi:hypothetical protein